MGVLDYQDSESQRAEPRPRGRLGLAVAVVALLVSLVPWFFLVSLKVEVASHEMGPGAGYGEFIFSLIGTVATVLLLLVWLGLAAKSGWAGRKIAGLALASLAFCWLILFNY